MIRPARMLPSAPPGWAWLAWRGLGPSAAWMSVSLCAAHHAADALSLRIVAADGAEVVA